MKNIAIATGVVALVCGSAALAIIFMPTKSAWADDYRQYESTLPNDDPLHQTLAPMLADGKLSIWEISGILCGEAYGCRLNNFADVLLSPEAADMFAQTVLVSLQHRKSSGDRKNIDEAADLYAPSFHEVRLARTNINTNPNPSRVTSQ